jgi:hypothetical protein
MKEKRRRRSIAYLRRRDLDNLHVVGREDAVHILAVEALHPAVVEDGGHAHNLAEHQLQLIARI